MKIESFRITAVRLVEFHNLGTTTVEIPDGGHLFLLGDNGSGKTTLLDAIHLVLTAGREMEFNSAARVAGSKDSGGRTYQGIVLRYNASTGRTAREAGITYAAVEFLSDAGRKLSLVIGLRAEGMDVAIERWGGLASVPVGELPLTVSEDGRLRAATMSEFKREMGHLAGGRAFSHISDYQTAVGERLFGGADKYADVCKLLRTGKAYREIAARAANYDELFRRLLEDPSRDTFEPLLKGLRELDESKARLEQLDERARYLDALVKGISRLDGFRHQGELVSWSEADHRRHVCAADVERLGAAIRAGEEERRGLEELGARTVAEADQARERVAALRAKDASGLLKQEKTAVLRVAEADRLVAGAAEEYAAARKTATGAAKRLAEERAARVKTLTRAAEGLIRQAKGTGIAVGTVTDALFGVQGETASEAVSDFAAAFATVRAVLVPRRDESLRTASLKRTRAGDARARTEAAHTALEEIRGQGENLPGQAGFAAARAEIRDQMLKARPLYELLEPASGCEAKRLATLERLVGEDFLATWVTDDNEADAVRRIAWKNGKGLAVAVRGENAAVDPTLLAPWLGQFVSFETSDLDAVRLLARHLVEATSPVEMDFLAHRTWRFRGREGLVPDEPPRLIGSQIRAAEQLRRERAAEQALTMAEREQRLAERAADEEEKLAAAICDLEGALDAARGESSAAAACVRVEQANALRFEDARRMAETRHAERQTTADQERSTLEDIRIKMKAEGVDATLEKRIASAERNVKTLSSKADELNRRVGGIRTQLKVLSEKCDACAREAETAEKTAEALAGRFIARVPEGLSIADYVRVTFPAAVAEETNFTELRETCALAARDVENDIAHRIRDPKGEPYGFSFDSDANRLVDRRGTALGDVVADENRRLEELREVINEKSREVFERIFMGEVMQRLYIDLMRIEDLVRRVQRLLKGRRFGSNRYDFVLTPVPEYEAFVRLVQKGYRLDTDEERKELRDYLDMHRDEIMNAEIDAIPDVFDYRKWFRFALKVFVENEEGLVIDRKVKSMGSGGEQAVPNYLLILTVAEFLYHGGTESERPKSAPLLFDEAFYGIDAARRDQLLAFAEDLGLQLFVSSPDQDGVKKEIRHSVSLIVVKDENLDVHLSPVIWRNAPVQDDIFGGGQRVGMIVHEETK